MLVCRLSMVIHLDEVHGIEHLGKRVSNGRNPNHLHLHLSPGTKLAHRASRNPNTHG